MLDCVRHMIKCDLLFIVPVYDYTNMMHNFEASLRGLPWF